MEKIEWKDLRVDEIEFWQPWPALLPLYETLRDALVERYPDLRIKVSKTQISFYNRHMFAMASGPWRRKKDWPRQFMLVSFGLTHRLDSPRVAMASEPYPHRWTHHVLVERKEQINAELLAWIDEAYRFSNQKRKKEKV